MENLILLSPFILLVSLLAAWVFRRHRKNERGWLRLLANFLGLVGLLGIIWLIFFIATLGISLIRQLL